jgi:5S rRNA maturation endonuclease (ribonuclease M5)
MGKLNKKEQVVILTDIDYKRGRKYLPPDVNELLATKINVKLATVRKIRERAVKKIKLAIDEINN